MLDASLRARCARHDRAVRVRIGVRHRLAAQSERAVFRTPRDACASICRTIRSAWRLSFLPPPGEANNVPVSRLRCRDGPRRCRASGTGKSRQKRYSADTAHVAGNEARPGEPSRWTTRGYSAPRRMGLPIAACVVGHRQARGDSTENDSAVQHRLGTHVAVPGSPARRAVLPAKHRKLTTVHRSIEDEGQPATSKDPFHHPCSHAVRTWN